MMGVYRSSGNWGTAVGVRMDKTVARLNIEHYHARLAEEKDDTTRQTLRQLITEEEQKLAQLTVVQTVAQNRVG